MDARQDVVDVSRILSSPRARVVLFVGLVLVGVAYVAVFVWFKQNSVDFIERDQDRRAAVAAALLTSPSVAWTFQSGSSALAMLGSGWRRSDPEATWTERHGGVLYLPARIAAGSEIEVRFDGHLVPSDQEMTVTLDANGERLGEWRLTHQHWQVIDRVTLPLRSAGGGSWRLQFAIQRPTRSRWSDVEPGLLAYGIRLHSLRTIIDAGTFQPPGK